MKLVSASCVALAVPCATDSAFRPQARCTTADSTRATFEARVRRNHDDRFISAAFQVTAAHRGYRRCRAEHTTLPSVGRIPSSSPLPYICFARDASDRGRVQRKRSECATARAAFAPCSRMNALFGPMASTPGAQTTAVSASPNGHDPESQGDEEASVRLRLAIVGKYADELGAAMAGRYGFETKSMDELMKGRKGRKTDNVKAKAVWQWLETEVGTSAVGAILIGFPTSEAHADALEKQGVIFDKLVVVHDERPLDMGGQDEPLTDIEDEVNENLLIARYEGKAIEILNTAADEAADIEKLCDSAVALLQSARSQGGESEIAEEFVTGGGELEDVSSRRPGGDESIARRQQQHDIPAGSEPEEYTRYDTTTVRMSPLEQASSVTHDPEDQAVASRASKLGAEAKRVARLAAKEKKAKANDAQQLETPFYVAVAQGQPKQRFRRPVPTIPSRITERLSSAISAPENTRLEFGPLILNSPASDCLLAAGITEPTGIQQAGMGPILNGESVILHAMTGSGKTLAFLLPLMQRWTPLLCSGLTGADTGGFTPGDEESESSRVILALPTRELAVQVAREVVLLAGGVTSSVELLVDSSVFHDLSSITAPVVVGSAKVIERLIRKSRPAVREAILSRVKCIVVDEVDRLVDVVSKHAPPREVERRKRHARPIAALLERVLKATPDVQVVACSATIGRPLKRELGHIVRRSSALGFANAAGPNAVTAAAAAANIEASGSRELRLIRDAAIGATSGANLATERAVAIPDTIRHYCVPLPDGDFFSRLEGLAAAVRELQPKRPLVFVPPQERVTAVVAHLRRSGGDIGRRAVALHEAMGFVSDEETGQVRGQHTSEAIEVHDQLTEEFRGLAGTPAGVAGVPEARSKATGATGDVRADGGAITADTGGVVDGDLLKGSWAGRLPSGEAAGLLVTGEDSARGLHFDDVDFVFLMQKPRGPDEYVHLAGRTGRQGKTGSVVTLASFEEFQKLQSWSTSLKVHFEPLDILNVVKRKR